MPPRAIRHLPVGPLFALSTALLTGLAGQARAITINPVFTTAITDASNAAQMEAAINSSIAKIDALYSNAGSISIVFTQAAGSFLGTSSAYDVSTSYATYTSLLTAVANSEPTNSTLATAVANFSHGNTTGTGGSVLLTQADAKLVFGSNQGGCFANDGTTLSNCNSANLGLITLSTSYSFNYGTTPVSGEYSVLDTIEHEIDEVLGGGGQGSVLNAIQQGNSSVANDLGVLDLYRYSAADTPSFTTSGSASSYFSVNGGVTDIIGFNQNSSGDYADFATNNNVQSAFSPTGIVATYNSSSPEALMLASIGYNLVTSASGVLIDEPAPAGLLAAALAALLFARRRTRRTT